jgi:diguanylate cyclase (GGDEF)-like protein/PAS domain S-box-containing protein
MSISVGGTMIEIVIPSLYVLAGVMAYAMFHHFSIGLHPPRDPMQILFGWMCLLAIPFVIFHAQLLQATDIHGFIIALKWNLSSIILFIIFFMWFIALYTGKRPKLFLEIMTLLLAILLVANLSLPNSLQYEQFDGIRMHELPWGETVTRGVGRSGAWVYFAISAVIVSFGYAIYALICRYRDSHQSADRSMLLAVCLFLLISSLGIFTRLSIVDFIEPGPLGILAMVIVMSVELTRETRKRLRTSERNFRTLFQNSPTGLVAVDADSKRIVQVNNAALTMSGFSEDEILNKSVKELTHPDDFDLQESTNNYEQLYNGLLTHISYESHYLKKDGSSFIGYTSVTSLKDDNDKASLFISSTIDITQRKQIENSLRESELRFRTLIEQSPISMAFGRDGIMLDANKAFLVLYGYKDLEEVRGQLVINRIAPQCRTDVQERIRKRALGESTEPSYETIGLRKDGSQFPLLITAKRIMLNDGPLTIAFEIDLTDRKVAAERINHLAFYDHLTNLPNRQLLLDRLEQTRASIGRNNQYGALLYIDLDDFKSFNDTLGHAIGDELLQRVAERLSSCVHEADTVARFGSDEFVVLLHGLSEHRIDAAEEAKLVCNKIISTISLPYHFIQREYQCTTSIGATLFNDHSQTTEDLVKQADIAMHHAKKSGRNNIQFFDVKMQEVFDTRASIESELRQSLKREQLHLYYQIQVDNSGRAIGAEALIRWIHPELGMVSPAQFIPIAEETGLILTIGHWVLESACAQLKSWEHDDATRNLVLAVNMSAQQFHQDGFVDEVRSVVRRWAINPNLLKLELTESMLLWDIQDTVATMNGLNEIGVRLSLDDFGTGYSSLQYLKLLPLNQIKIDQSFVCDVATNQNDAVIVQTIIAMAHALGLDLIAEGVETAAQRELLNLRGCHAFQGYLFGKPAPIEQFETLLKKR